MYNESWLKSCCMSNVKLVKVDRVFFLRLKQKLFVLTPYMQMSELAWKCTYKKKFYFQWFFTGQLMLGKIDE